MLILTGIYFHRVRYCCRDRSFHPAGLHNFFSGRGCFIEKIELVSESNSARLKIAEIVMRGRGADDILQKNLVIFRFPT